MRFAKWWQFGQVGKHSRFKSHHQSDSSFLFSTWPIPEYRGGIPTVVVTPDDANRMQAAANRLAAISGGVLRLTHGDYVLNNLTLTDTELHFEGPL